MENCMKKKIGIIGAGSFGTAMAVVLAGKGHQVSLWGRNRNQLQLMRDKQENTRYLPGVILPKELIITDKEEEAIYGAQIVIFAVPSQSFRSVFEESVQFIAPDTVVVNVAKGIEKTSLLRLSQVAEELMPGVKYVALSGPSHAEEVARQMPATVVASSRDEELARYVQETFNTDRFRVYTNTDVTGVELGGALKNIIALAAGVSDGLGFGDSAKAAIMTRGITEICRLGTKLGARSETFSGLTGVGDLVVTCTSVHSRNRRCGILIGEGVDPNTAVGKIGMVVEGISTAAAASALAQRENVEMPITECVCGVIDGRITVDQAVELLMSRDMKREMTDMVIDQDGGELA